MNMRFRVPLFALLLVAGSFVLPLAAHAAIPFFGPIIPEGLDVCPTGWGAVMIVVNNIISLLLTLAIVFVAPIMIAYAGFLFVVNSVNPTGIDKAKGILLNTVVGIIIALAGWLIVNAVMAVFYKPSAVGGASWWQIVTSSGPPCLDQKGALPDAGLNQALVTGVTATGGTLSTTISTVPGSACNPSTVIAAAPNASISQANLLACIARGESTCGAMNPPYNLNYSWNKAGKDGKASTAAGAYQVLLSSNHTCYENNVCYAAAGVSGPLNCQNAFDSKGFPISGTTLTNCEKAAGNVSCSAAAAVCLLSQQSFASAYATDRYMASCQSQYGS